MSNEIKPAYWNGEPCKARRVRVIVGKSPRDTWWCADLEGQERSAIEIEYHGQKFYLNDDADALEKITVGRGSPQYGHASLPVDRVVSP